MRQKGQQSNVFDFNHNWRFSERDYSVLPDGRWHKDVYDYAKAGGMLGPAQLVFRDDDWQKVTLPHDWVTAHEFTPDAIMNHGYQTRGIGWYRNYFQLDEKDLGSQILLEFEGMSSSAEIYVNGQLLRRNFSGYRSFCVDVTDQAHYGDVPNLVAVRIDAGTWEGWWYEGAGIYRPAWLIKKPPVHAARNGIWVRPIRLNGEQWKLEVRTELENSSSARRSVELTTELETKNGNRIDSKRESAVVEGYSTLSVLQTFIVNSPKLWSPEDPELYCCRTVVGEGESTDRVETKFGFRAIRLDPDTGFWLNGQNRKFKGFCCHQDHGGLGVAVPYAVKEFRIKKLKELGADAYRCAHNPDPEITEICDRLGMLVMDENRIFGTSEENLRCLKDQIKFDRNHPSVCLYSVFNEEPLQGSACGRRMAERMQAEIKKLDPDRPVTAALNSGFLEESGASAVLESVGFNYCQDLYDVFHKKFPKTPFYGSETASGFATRGEYKSDPGRNILSSLDDEFSTWGDTARNTWKAILKRPYVAGSFVWSGFDYGGEPSPCKWPSVSSFFGAYDACGFPKVFAYLYKALYKEEPYIHLERCKNGPVVPGTQVEFAIITNCREAEILCKGEAVCEKQSPDSELLRLTLPDSVGPWEVRGIQDGKPVCSAFLKVADRPVALRAVCNKQTLGGDDLDAVVLDVYAVDEDGNFCPWAEDKVSFRVSGSGRIRGVCNGDPNCHEKRNGDSIRLFHGCAQAVLSKSAADPLTVSINSDGLSGTEVLLKDDPAESLPRVEGFHRIPVEGWTLCHTLFDEHPSADRKPDENDMNSMLPVSFEGKPQAMLTGSYGKYALYRGKLPERPDLRGAELFFGGILGKAWIYEDGILLAEKENPRESAFSVSLPDPCKGQELTVILQNCDFDWQQCGIIHPIFLQKQSNS